MTASTPHRSGAACATHQEKDATFFCPGCLHYYCEACIEHRFVGDGFRDLCRRCNQPAEALPPPATADTGAFVARLGEIVTFPALPGVFSVLVGLAVLVAPISWAAEHNIMGALATLGSILVLGIELSVFFHFIHQASRGADLREMHAPDFFGIWDDVYGPVTRLLAAVLPLVAVLVWSSISLGSIALIPTSGLHLGALISALLLFPLLLMLAALAGSAADVLNPVVWARTLSLLGSRYWIAAPILYVLMAAYMAWNRLGAPVLLAIPLFGRVAALLVGYVIMSMAAKTMGLLLEPHLR